MRRTPIVPWLVLVTLVCGGCTARAPAAKEAEPDPAAPGYVFAWPFLDASEMAPRGGTSRGETVGLAPVPMPQWKNLRAASSEPFDRDRAAILAMAGEYRVSFDFLETVVFEPPFTPDKPYRSWATEKVYVVEDRGDFISLQHILEMVFIDDEGNRQGPFVQKHWRQDWTYEPEEVFEYAEGRRWVRRGVAPQAGEGAWSQAVFQVDDTPRYASVGRWEHDPVYSAWTGSRTARPLPRRESSVRQDYDRLLATNRHTILPQGWVHEEDNLKQALAAGRPDAETDRVLSREIGVNRYQGIEDFDFSAADAYWKETGPLWAEVRAAWKEKLASSSSLEVAKQCRGKPAFVELFGFAERLRGAEPPSAQERSAFVSELIDCITRPPS